MPDKPYLKQSRFTRLFSLTAIAGFISVLALLLIPGEGGSAFILGYSKTRLILLLIPIFITVVSAYLFTRFRAESQWGKNFIETLNSWARNNAVVWWTRVISMAGIGVGSYLLVTTFLTGDLYLKGILLRLSPLMGLTTFVLFQINIVCLQLSKKTPLSQLYVLQLYQISLIWTVLNLVWVMATHQFLTDDELFMTALIFISNVFFWVIFFLEYRLFAFPRTQWITGITVLAANILSTWMIHLLQNLAISQVIFFLFSCACIGQILFLSITLYHRPKKKLITFSKFCIDIHTVILTLVWIATILVILGILTQIGSEFLLNFSNNLIRNLFHLDGEKNIPAYFSVGILLLSSVLLFLTFNNQRKKNAKFSFHWLILGLIFLYLSLDELMSIHESLIGPVRQQVEGQGIFSYEWVLIAIPLVIILAIAYFRFLIHLPARTRTLFIIAGIIYIGGSLGGEMLSGWYASNFGEGDINYTMLTVLEESLEIAGIIIFISALLFNLAEQKSREINTHHTGEQQIT